MRGRGLEWDDTAGQGQIPGEGAQRYTFACPTGARTNGRHGQMADLCWC